MARVKRLTRRRMRGLSPEEVADLVPFRVKVGRLRWLLGLAIFGLGALFFVWVLFVDDSGTTPMGALYEVVMWFALPLSVMCLVPYVMGVFVPRHLTVTAEGLSTRHWSVRWDQVEQIMFGGGADGHTVQAAFYVDNDLWQSGLMRANRWDSGTPLGAGGLLNSTPAVRTQANLVPNVDDLTPVFEVLHGRAWERAGHVGGYDNGTPVMPDGRRAIAPNVAADDAVPQGGA